MFGIEAIINNTVAVESKIMFGMEAMRNNTLAGESNTIPQNRSDEKQYHGCRIEGYVWNESYEKQYP